MKPALLLGWANITLAPYVEKGLEVKHHPPVHLLLAGEPVKPDSHGHDPNDSPVD